MGELKVAIIGCGRMGGHTSEAVQRSLPQGWVPNNHAEAAASLPGLRVVACCDLDRSAAEDVSRRFGGRAYVDYREALAVEAPDIVTIATRAEGRADIIATCANRGVRAIHAEKPLCRSLQEADKAAAAVCRNKVAFSFGATRRYMAAYRHARDLVASGRFGQARQIHLNFRAGTLQWTHPHSVDMALFFAGEAELEFAQAAFSEPASFDGTTLDADPQLVMGFLRFSNGFSGLITAAPGWDLAVACEAGTVSVLSDGSAVETRSAGAASTAYFVNREVINPSSELSGLQAALAELRDSIIKGMPTSSSIDQALRGQRAIFALALSGLRQGAEVRLADVPSKFTLTGRLGTLYA